MFNNGDNTANGGRPYINGNREQSNNFILDGMDNNQTSENNLGFTPAPDAIQEFNLITNNASAEFGNFMGGIVNASIKSGTNKFHGDAWEFFRNDVLNANQWENKLNPSSVLPQAHSPLEYVRRHPWWSDHQGQAVLLRGLPGTAFRPSCKQQLHYCFHERRAQR